MKKRTLFFTGFLILGCISAGLAEIIITGVAPRSRHVNAATFTVTGADSAVLNGQPVAIGSPVTVTEARYHELVAGDGTARQTVPFIVKSAGRGSSEDGLPSFTPRPWVADAPSAFADGALRVLCPPRFPKNLPLPVAARLVKGAAFGAAAGDPLWLNGRVAMASFPGESIRLRRGWGSSILPPQPAVMPVGHVDFSVNGLAASVPLEIEETTVWTEKSGVIAGAEEWGVNARIYLTANVTVGPAGSLTIGRGSVVRCAPGVEICVRPGGLVRCAGTLAEPIAFVPDAAGRPWGGLWLQPQSGGNAARLEAEAVLFCCWGADQDWHDAALPPGEPARSFSRHRDEQPLCAIGAGAVCALTDCALIGPVDVDGVRGTAFASANGTLRLDGTLVHRCTTGGQQNGGAVEIHSCAFLEMTEPGADIDSPAFVDEDNDGLYLVPGAGRTYHLSKTVIGWVRDDGIDTGASGAGATLCADCWFENCTHEAISCSGAGRVPESRRGVHFNSGQGMECGYGSGGSGPLSLLEDCAVIGNMVGARYGDNYGGGSWSYGGTMAVRRSLLLYNEFHDAWAMEFTAWAAQNQRLILQDSFVTNASNLADQNNIDDMGNALWDPARDGARLAPFMPVPGSAVGVDFAVYHRQQNLLHFPGLIRVQLSTFSSHMLQVPWRVVGKAAPDASEEEILAQGHVSFAPGEVAQSFAPALPEDHGKGFLAIVLGDADHAQATGAPLLFFARAEAPAPEILIPKAAGGWSYQALRREPAPDAGGLAWTARSYAGTEWQQGKQAPIGFGGIGGAATISLGATLSSAEQGPSSDRTRTVYFRKEFEVGDRARLGSLTLEWMRDDGAVIYLNGTEILRDNIDAPAGGAISYDVWAADSIGDDDESAHQAVRLPFSALLLLAEGRNVLAAEVHQVNQTSSDLVFDAQLSAELAADEASPLSVGHVEGKKFLYWFGDEWQARRSPDLDRWSPVGGGHSPLWLEFSEDRLFFRLER